MPDLIDPYARITTSQAAIYAEVTPAAIVNWRRRGHLHPIAWDHGRPLYQVIDVAKAEHATRKRARRKENPHA
jgi:hypothetical protein